MPDAILILNAGSSSMKFGLYEIRGPDEPGLLSRGMIAEIDGTPHFTAKNVAGTMLVDEHWQERGKDIVTHLIGWVEKHLAGEALVAAGHRIVHGGRDFIEPVRLTTNDVQALDALTPLAPLHQPGSLAPIRALAALRPNLTQIGCFDTAFHHDLKPPVSRFALPRKYEMSGIRRYGFHGLSYEFIAHRLRKISKDLAARRTVVAHLGNGCSLCAMRDGKSVDTTMGFTALDGLMMGTRCGAIDPGILLYLQQTHAMSVNEIEHLLYNESGLLGVSGLSSDMRTLLARKDPHAAEAVELFVFRLAREICAMANTLGGIECLVFTGGIGEHAQEVRAMTCDRLGWLGVELDTQANEAGNDCIGAKASRVDIRIIPTDEEMTIARHVLTMIEREPNDGQD